jgi:hypothetical protein
MLVGLALKHYFTDQILGSLAAPTFDELCDATRSYFEEPEYHRSTLEQWNAITLRLIINNNPGKSVQECLTLLISELRRLNRRFDISLRSEESFQNKLRIACQGIIACPKVRSIGS